MRGIKTNFLQLYGLLISIKYFDIRSRVLDKGKV
jgi:hypothetical protein